MKNNILFILTAGCVVLFSSCGTANRATYASSDFINGIYYTPDSKEIEEHVLAQAEFENLRKETSQYIDNRSKNSVYTTSGNTQTIFVGDTNVVNIDYTPTYTYSIVDDEESYEARLRKFDSPVYTINIEWNDPYSSWWDVWYRPSWITWGTAWYNPWWGLQYSWWGPSWGWNHWYAGYNPWWGYHHYDPWWGPAWGYPHYGPGWDYGWGPGWGPAPFPPHHRPHRDIYYGKREHSPSYNNSRGHSGSYTHGSSTRRNPDMNLIRGNGKNNIATSGTQHQNRPEYSGSAYRRGANSIHNGAVYNNNAANAGSGRYNTGVTPSSVRPGNQATSGGNRENSMYRRSSVKSSSQNAGSSKQQYNRPQNSNNSNSRNNSSYRSSNYNRENSSSYSSGNSGNYRSSGSMSTGSRSTGSRSGGSSYRR